MNSNFTRNGTIDATSMPGKKAGNEATAIPIHTPFNNTLKPPPTPKDKNKGSGPVNFFRVALYMLSRKNKKSKPLPVDSSLTRLVGSFRPLHLQDNDSQLSPSAPASPSPQSDAGLVFPHQQASAVEGFISSAASSSSSSSYEGMSRYASAQNLQELDCEDDDDDENGDSDSYYDGIEGDEMIDTKAEEFIAQFYRQMRMNKLGRVRPCM